MTIAVKLLNFVHAFSMFYKHFLWAIFIYFLFWSMQISHFYGSGTCSI